MPDQSNTVWMYIYILLDPSTNRPCYVGQTRHPEQRYARHLRESRDTEKCRWVRDLQSGGIQPSFAVISVVPRSDAGDEERFWIAALKRRGYHLVNGTTGGNTHFTLSAIARERISRANTGKVRTPEFRARVSEVSLERWQDPEARAEMIANRTAARTYVKTGPRPPEIRAKISAAMKGVPKKPDAHKRMIEAAQKRTWSPERRAHSAEIARRNFAGKPPWNKGKKGIIVSDKALQALADGRKKRYAPKAPVREEPSPSSSWTQQVLDL